MLTITKPQPLHAEGLSLRPYEIIIIDNGHRTSIMCIAKNSLDANRIVAEFLVNHMQNTLYK